MVFLKDLRYKKISLILAAALLFCCVIYFLSGVIITKFIDADAIETFIKKQTGLDLVLDKPSFKTMPDLSVVIKADLLSLSVKSENKEFLSAKNPNLRVRILPVLFKRVSIASFQSDDLRVSFSRDEKSIFDFEKYIPKDIKLPLKINFSRTKVLIGTFRASFVDLKNKKEVEINSNKFKIYNYTDSKFLHADLESSLKVCTLGSNSCNTTNFAVKSKLKFPLNKNLDSRENALNVAVKNFRLDCFKDYLKEFTGVEFSDFNGTVNFAIKTDEKKRDRAYLVDFDTNDIKIKFPYNGKNNSIVLDGQSLGRLSFAAYKNELVLGESYFSTDNASASVAGKILKYKTKKPQLDLKLKINDSDFLKFIKIIPAGFVVYKTDVINELLKANPYARMQGELDILGNYTKPDVYGKLKIYDIYLFERPKGFDTAVALCEFKKDRVYVDVNVPAPDSQFVKVKGYSELYGKQAGEYDIVSSDRVNLAYAHKYLIPVQRVIGFKLGPLPYMKIDGIGKIHIKAVGTIYDALVNGKFFGENITTSLSGLNMQLQDGRVELDFNGKVIEIVNTSAKAADGTFLLSGTADDYGNLDIKSELKNISAAKLADIAKTSELIKQKTGDLSILKSASGRADMTVIFKGKAQSLEGLDFLKYIMPEGSILFKNVSAAIKPNVLIEAINGTIQFKEDYVLNITSLYKGSKVSLSGVVTPSSDNLMQKGSKLKLKLDTSLSNMEFSSVLQTLREQNYLGDEKLKFALNNSPVGAIDFLFDANAKILGTIPVEFALDDLSNLSLKGAFVPKNTAKSKNISFKSGTYKIDGQKIFIKNSNISLFDTNIICDGIIENIFSKPVLSLKFVADSVPLSNLNNMINYVKAPLVKAVLQDFCNYKGLANVNVNIRKNSPSGKITFESASVYNKKLQSKLELKSGLIKLSGNKLILDSLNLTYGDMPLYLNSVILNYLTKKPAFNAMFTTNITESSADRLINPYLLYPLKVKGEIRLKGRIKGGLNNYSLISYLTLPKDTDISFMGANFGDVEYEREFQAKADFTRNTAKINGTKYTKFIPSQNNKPTPLVMLKIDGKVVSVANKLIFDNLRINTPNPLTAKFFNVIFKKSVLKQGLFTCDLNLNGDVMLPHATGRINFQNVNMPLYSTKINDMDFVISKNTINANMKGKSFDSDIDIDANIVNKQNFPIVVRELNIKSKRTSLSGLFEGLSQIPKGSSDIVPGQPIIFKPQDLVIVKGNAVANDVELYNIKAQNLKGSFSNPTGLIFNIDNMYFDIAGGSVSSKGKFDFDSLLFNIDSSVENCDANELSESFLGLSNQIYGKANGKINIRGKIPQNAQDIKSINGNIEFSVNDGKMPKLGSLEYLLRAGNLIKSGLFGLTLNNLIEVLTPYKTGEFSAIKGSFKLHDAKINSLEIFSKGKNLSLFIYGDYDIMNDDAEIEILGRLSKNVSNVLGGFGNASLNSLFNAVTGNKLKEGAKKEIIENVNKIPLIELSGDDYRLFVAKIKGRLNSDNYVKSFNWLN